jgi:hypothetical protein
MSNSVQARISQPMFWPKAKFIVAWGNAPGAHFQFDPSANLTTHVLAEGQIHRSLGQRPRSAFPIRSEREFDDPCFGRRPNSP